MPGSQLMMATALVLVAAKGQASGQTAAVNWRLHAPFTEYKTYSWVLNEKQQDSPYWQFVRADINRELYRKHLHWTSARMADLKVIYRFSTPETTDAGTTLDGFGWSGGPWGHSGGWGGWGNSDSGISDPVERPRTLGILSIDLIDSRTNEVVWRGQTTGDTPLGNEKGDERQIRSSIAKMFEQFPPRQ